MLGRTYDLGSLYKRLNRLYFDSQLSVEVEWSQMEPRKARRSIQLGSYDKDKNKIRLSRRLDNPRVPLFVVECVLFHEMLHAVFPREDHRMHSDKFKRFERMHPDYNRAVQWEKDNLKVLFEASQRKLPLGHSA